LKRFPTAEALYPAPPYPIFRLGLLNTEAAFDPRDYKPAAAANCAPSSA